MQKGDQYMSLPANTKSLHNKPYVGPVVTDG